jgi:hypothetical protein
MTSVQDVTGDMRESRSSGYATIAPSSLGTDNDGDRGAFATYTTWRVRPSQ